MTPQNLYAQRTLFSEMALAVLGMSDEYALSAQLGGGDQWGNITAGCEFVRKATGNIVHGEL